MTVITTPEALTTLTRISRAGVVPTDYRVVLAGRAVGIVSDEAGVIASRGRYAAWSVAFGPKGFHHTQEAAAARVVAAWLNVGHGPTRLLTAAGTVHASRPADVAGGRAPACMTNHAAGALKIMLRTGRDVTCRHCPKG